jgi:hypothetical protein
LERTDNVRASCNGQPDVARNAVRDRMFALSSARLQDHTGRRIALNRHRQDTVVSGLVGENTLHYSNGECSLSL